MREHVTILSTRLNAGGERMFRANRYSTKNRIRVSKRDATERVVRIEVAHDEPTSVE